MILQPSYLVQNKNYNLFRDACQVLALKTKQNVTCWHFKKFVWHNGVTTILNSHLISYMYPYNFRTNIFFLTSNILKEVKGGLISEGTVKLGNKERFDKKQIGIKELFMDYKPFYTLNLLLDKELLPI